MAIIQTYHTRRGPELRVRPLRRCKGCGQPHSQPMRQAEPAHETPADFIRAFLVMVLLVAAGIAFTIAAVGYFPVGTA